MALVKVNLDVLRKELGKIEDAATRSAERFTREAANTAIKLSTPRIQTGAYITSFSITTGGSGRPRGKSSHGRPKTSNKQGKVNEARALLESDISKIDFSNVDSLVLRNGAPHAQYVELNAQGQIFTRLTQRMRTYNG